MEELKEIQKKLILLGDGEVGKTSLVRRFVVDKFDDRYILTIGTKVTAKALQVKTEDDVHYLKLQIWDILGQKGYTKLHQSSFRGTDGVFMVADITRQSTLYSLATYWMPKVKKMIGEVPLIILANKTDLLENAEFNEQVLGKFAQKLKVPYFLTSAKNGENVKTAFYDLGKMMLEKRKPEFLESKKGKIIHPRLLFEGDMSEITSLIDKIIDDFCKEYGTFENAMPVLRKQFEIAGLDLNNPKKMALRRAVHRLAKVESAFKSEELVEANLVKRLKWIKDLELGD